MVITADVKKRRHVLYVMSSLLKHHLKINDQDYTIATKTMDSKNEPAWKGNLENKNSINLEPYILLSINKINAI